MSCEKKKPSTTFPPWEGLSRSEKDPQSGTALTFDFSAEVRADSYFGRKSRIESSDHCSALWAKTRSF